MRSNYNVILFALLIELIICLPLSAKGDKNKPVSCIDSLSSDLVNWYNKDHVNGEVYGASVDKSYEFLKGKEPKNKIIVAVIDGGIDIKHKDIVESIWTNEGEIPNNNIDDDGNGYIDDVNGWNFIGSSGGVNIENENIEYVRLYRKYYQQFKNANAKKIPSELKDDFQLFIESEKFYLREKEKYSEMSTRLMEVATKVMMSEALLKNFLNKEEISAESIRKIKHASEKIISARDYMIRMYDRGYTKESFIDIRANTDLHLDTLLNVRFIARERIIGDDISDISDVNYGNNDVVGPKAEHGTHVAGIIGATRGNNIGIDGVANHIEIMPIRCIPQGDEYDKDIALAIRYAVDNGAKIINMSFGKETSPQKIMVDSALKYAEEHNVLLIHASGNNGVNIDENIHYPDKRLNDGDLVSNWICVGANSNQLDKSFVGIFSNYGIEQVDLFAPGVDIISLFPGDRYKKSSGTSMACPVVSGIAAIIWSYYPNLSMQQVKGILLDSSNKFPKLKVYRPDIVNVDKKKKVKFSKLSSTGGVINAFRAVQMAEKLSLQSAM